MIVRPLAAGLFVLSALAAAALALGVWVSAGALDADRFGDRSVEALRAPEGRAAIAARIGGAAGLPPSGPAATALDEVVAAVVADPAFAGLVAPGLAGAHRSYLRGDDAALALEPVRTEVARRAGAIDPALAAAVPPAGSIDPLPLAESPPLDLDILAEVGEAARPLTALLTAASLILVLLALAVSRRPAATAAVAGLGFGGLAALALLGRATGPSALGEAVGAAAGDPVAAAAAERLGEALVQDALPGALVCAAAALVLLAGAALGAGRGR